MSNNPVYVSGLVATLKAVIADTSSVSTECATWWNARLDTTLAGHDWARNPEGFFLKGIAPATKRNPDKVIKQFQLGLQMGLTSNMEKSARTVGSALANASIEAGLFQSFARKASQYGSDTSRKIGNDASKLASQGGKIAGIAKELANAENERLFDEVWSSTLAVEDLKRRLNAVKIPKIKGSETAKQGRK